MNAIEVMNAMAVAYNARDIDAMMNLISDNCIMQQDRGEILTAGKPSIREFYSNGFKNHPNLHLEIKEHLNVGTALLVKEFNTGYVVDGKEIDFESAWAYQILDGKIELMHYFSAEYKRASTDF